MGTVYAQKSASSRKIEDKDGIYIVHKVAPKQTLYAISKMYSVSVKEIQKANDLNDNSGIRIGQSIRIPVKRINTKDAKRSQITLGSDTIFHYVLKKDTWYALSNKYEISQEKLLLYNGSLGAVLKIGMTVKIPLLNHSESFEYKLPFQDSFLIHEIKPKETLYSLSKLYDVSIDSIQIANDGLGDGLRIGKSIRIPILSPNYTDELKKTEQNIDQNKKGKFKLKKGDTLRIGIFLPFCNEKNRILQAKEGEETLYFLTKISLEFMRGLELAKDSLNQIGYHVVTEYFDTQNDTGECIRIIREEALDKMHLFIGPLFQMNFKIFALAAEERKIPIIAPVNMSSLTLSANKYVIKSKASIPSQINYETQYIGNKYADSNIIILAGKSPKDRAHANIYQKELSELLNDSLPIHIIWQPNVDNFRNHLDEFKTNYVILSSENEAFVASALSAFNEFNKDVNHTRFEVFGLANWKSFDSIDYGYLSKLHVTYPSIVHIEYYDPEVVSFIRHYRDRYYTEPSSYVFSAFDIGWYFGNAFFESKGDWESYAILNQESGLSLRFNFIKVDNDGGLENQGIFLLEHTQNGMEVIH